MRFLGVLLLIGIIVGVAAVMLFVFDDSAADTPSGGLTIELSSAPFPMTIGVNRLRVLVSDSNGSPVEGADVAVSGLLDHGGMLPLRGVQEGGRDGEYVFRVVWPMNGSWTIDVTAQTGEDSEALTEQFSAYVYALPPEYDKPAATYRLIRETTADMAQSPDSELWIVIPQGTYDMVRRGHDELPDDIRLQVGRRDTLVIRNDDIVDHTIGPFFIRSGETIRQRFTQAAVFQGVCSLNDVGYINIVVEG
ncbi:MAG: FixH family protein [Chloroflexi bacterium]|nr:FixH family protein [Chloroflexota bacterium]